MILVAEKIAKQALGRSVGDVKLVRKSSELLQQVVKMKPDGVVLDDGWMEIWPEIKAVAPRVSGIAYVTGANDIECGRANECGLFAYIGNDKPAQLVKAVLRVTQMNTAS